MIYNEKKDILLDLVDQSPDGLVVEIGCIRYASEMSSEGFSTFYLAKYCHVNGRVFRSFDNILDHVELANSILKERGLPESVVCKDGLYALEELRDGAIGFLYLDSSDNPVDTLNQYHAAKDKLVHGSIILIDDAHTYWAGEYGKATYLINELGLENVELVDVGQSYRSCIVRKGI